MVYLTVINGRARDHIKLKHGKMFPYCKEGANRFVKLARDAGYKGGRVKRVSGFCKGQQHHWAIDTKTGWIYDPTQAQFYVEFVSVIRKNHPRYVDYIMIDEDDGGWWIKGSGSDNMGVYSSWLALKKWKEITGSSGDMTTGHDTAELRHSVKGDPYMYMSTHVFFNHHDFVDHKRTVTSEKFRCATIFEANNGGINVGALFQRLVFKDGKTYKPTTIRTLHRHANGTWLRKKKGKWVKLDRYTTSYLWEIDAMFNSHNNDMVF